LDEAEGHRRLLSTHDNRAATPSASNREVLEYDGTPNIFRLEAQCEI
jgi:hypothetical protein